MQRHTVSCHAEHHVRLPGVPFTRFRAGGIGAPGHHAWIQPVAVIAIPSTVISAEIQIAPPPPATTGRSPAAQHTKSLPAMASVSRNRPKC
ncbi:hypothetical protein ABZ734_16940 [Streptomyces sp. NPDC006660]|uniref:hypothetical protein n=1 Tax=unclassified Streptomyces TaxID=2593676 RepID=UPI0033F8F836